MDMYGGCRSQKKKNQKKGNRRIDDRLKGIYVRGKRESKK